MQCAPQPFPGIIPFLGCQALTLGGADRQKHGMCVAPPQEGFGASSPAPSAVIEPLHPLPCWPLSPGILPASRAPLGTLSLPCLWVDLIHAWLYMQTCAGGSSLKGGEGNAPTARGSSGARFAAVFCCC